MKRADDEGGDLLALPVRDLVRLLAREVARELQAGARSGMISQAQSSLGRRRHIAAVRRRIAAGEDGAMVLGREYLLDEQAHEDEMRRLATASKKCPPRQPKQPTLRQEMLARHGLVEEDVN